MLTIVITNRNRDLRLVENCLVSLNNQSNEDFQVVVVDYGSEERYLRELKNLATKYQKIRLISINTSGQLWCKSRAINLALKPCETPHFFVGDIDMVYHPNFVETLHGLKNKYEVVYFQVGFLSEPESKKAKAFHDYEINFKSTNEATGMTLYKTEVLKAVNGYDEFYNGWGSEDTDTHVRLQNAKKEVVFFDKEVLVLHQWHPKTYRNKDSTAPFHSYLEKINKKYLEYTKQTKKVKANTKFDWGTFKDVDYKSLEHADFEFNLNNELSDIKGFLNSVLLNLENKVVLISVKRHKGYKSLKNIVKKVLGKKNKVFLTMQEVNDLLLETIIMNRRNSAYKYAFNRDTQEISLTIKL